MAKIRTNTAVLKDTRQGSMITTDSYLINPQKHQSELPGFTLPGVFAATVAANGDKVAVFDNGHMRSWQEWANSASALARGLQELGVTKGEVVALHLPNSWEYLTMHVAIATIGAVMFPLHMAYGEHELRILLERAEVTTLVMPTTYGKRDLREMGRDLLTELSSLKHVLITGTEGQNSLTELENQWAGTTPHPVEVSPDDPFVLLASSGTTSLRPKICIHSHTGLLSNAALVCRDGKASRTDTIISASPFTHLFGLLSIHLSLFSQGQQALLSGWNTENFLELVSKAEANVLFAVPAQLRDVCIYLDSHPEFPRLKLREVRTGGAGVPAQLVADVRRVLGASVMVQWGMSEIGAGTFTRPEDPPEAASSSIGRPIDGAEARIAGEDGAELAIGETGELWYRSPYSFRGYLGDKDITEQAVTPDGWLKTGDLASRNEDGTIAYRGRRTEFINRGGLKFSAVEVESLLTDLAALSQFAVIAQADERLGQRSLLVASTRPGYSLTLEEVTAHLAAKGLAKFKWPEELVLVDELPATPTGKIARVRLAELLRAKPS